MNKYRQLHITLRVLSEFFCRNLNIFNWATKALLMTNKFFAREPFDLLYGSGHEEFESKCSYLNIRGEGVLLNAKLLSWK